MLKLDFYVHPYNPFLFETQIENKILNKNVYLEKPLTVREILHSLCKKDIKTGFYYLDLYKTKSGEYLTIEQYHTIPFTKLFSVTIPMHIEDPINLSSIRILRKTFKNFKLNYPESYL